MTPYQVLGLTPDASLADIKAAYRQRMMACHPDKGGSDEEAKLVNKAYEALTKRQTWQDWINAQMRPTVVVVFTSGTRRETWTW